MYRVVDSAFNRSWYWALIGKTFLDPPGYAQVEVVGTYQVIVEAFDEVDADALKERIELFLKTADNGDYSGHAVTIKQV